MKNCFWVFVLVGQLVSAAVIDHLAFFGSTGSPLTRFVLGCCHGIRSMDHLTILFFESDQSFKTLFVFLIKQV